jgi:NADPH:quinone reductase-like Zn-dependent oxidoreductase
VCVCVCLYVCVCVCVCVSSRVTHADLHTRIPLIYFPGGTPTENAQAYDAINEALTQGTIRPIVGKTFSLADAPLAHVEVLEHASGSAGKIVLHVEH